MSQITEHPGNSGWCMTCCTRHALETPCPGELPATGPEINGWRVNVETPRGVEAYGVLIAESYELWRARIMTFPNVLWLAPGSRGSMKFVGSTAEVAEEKAVQFIKRHCHSRGYSLRTDLVAIQPTLDEANRVFSVPSGGAGLPATRKVRFLPIGFGVSQVTEIGGTGNLSETGLFIITDVPMNSGTELRMDLDIGSEVFQMLGSVVWMRRQPHAGRTAGMGIRLTAPSQQYRDYVRSLS